jgi:hypothetical protein
MRRIGMLLPPTMRNFNPGGWLGLVAVCQIVALTDNFSKTTIREDP